MNKFKQTLAVAMFAFSSVALANGVMMEMFQMNKHMGAFNRAQTAEEFQESAKQFLVQAEKAKNTMPASLGGDKVLFKGYQAGRQEVIDEVKKAEELAKQDKLEEAKMAVSRLNGLKKKYHSEYK
ncbi:cytochrome b562 [Actinobacillus pleuropneumoniae]|uniref:cytochrome b562 n=1 Tax=Actinobacillus pleuropneumoniae TaxID=715 RepID=UPI003B27C768